MNALIGYTGFVGSNLCRDRVFSDLYNSKNIQEIEGRKFENLVCAGTTATKWWANQNPKEDLVGIQSLIDRLGRVQVDRLVLISTIDVYKDPVGVTESDTPIKEGLHPYGLHRLMLEEYVTNTFQRSTIVRLPGLFGPGLKKNVIFDLMHDNNLESINPDSAFQWYPITRLAADLDVIQEAGLGLLNIAAEPIVTENIRSSFFPEKSIGQRSGNAIRYDMKTEYCELLGGNSGYHIPAVDILAELELFLS